MKQVSTKKALIASMLSMLVCVSMLIGSTFAWFTDSASTNVNTIKSGSLEVELIKGDEDVKLGDSLKWVKADGHEDEEVLWEPGATYDLESFRIKNSGTLAIKYKIVVNGLTGSAKLLEALDFTVKVEGDDKVDTIAALNGYEGKLSASAITGKITISGTMRKDAGNEYMNEEISGISIAVYATQATEEYDSNGNTYDEEASYPVEAIVPVQTKTEEGVTKVAEDVTIKSAATVEDADKSVATAIVPAETKLEADTANLKLVIKETDEPDGFVVETDAKAATYDVSVEGVAADNETEITVELYVGKNLADVKLYHNAIEMAASAYSYDAATGYITFKTATFSPFTVTYTVPTIVADGVAYDKLEDAIAGANGAKIVLNEDVKTENGYKFSGEINIDLNGHTWELGNNTGIEDASCIMNVSNGKILGAGSSSYIDIRVGANNSAAVKFDGVDFENVYRLNGRTGGSSTIYTDYILKYSPNNGTEKLDLSFVGCSFKNAAVKMNGYSKAGEVNAVFEDCKFNALTNNALLEGDYYTTGNVNIKNCSFDVIVTSNVTVVSFGRNVKVTAEGTNTFDGRVAVDELDRAAGSEYPIKLYSEQSAKAGVSGENVILKGFFTE